MEFVNKYGTLLISILCGFASVIMVLAVFNTTELGAPIADFAEVGLSQNANADNARVDYEIPEASITVMNDILEYGQPFNWKHYIEVTIDGETKDEYKDYVSLVGTVDTTQGETSQTVTFVLNWNGNSISKKGTFYVRGQLN